MLKKRIIANLTIMDGIVVQSINFERYLPIGRPEIAVEFLNSWGVDEIVLVDIRAGIEKRTICAKQIQKAAKKCFVPLTVGGGVRCVSDAATLLQSGADKVLINSAALNRPELISDIAEKFGAQCALVSIDAKQTSPNSYEVYGSSGQEPSARTPLSWAIKCQELGAGEILLNSIDRDGSKLGYDLPLLKSVTEALKIPVIALGGVGHPEHFSDGISKGNAAAVAAGNFFHFSEHSVITAKSFLKINLNIRLDAYANYTDSEFSSLGRVKKKSDSILQNLRFQHYEKEVI